MGKIFEIQTTLFLRERKYLTEKIVVFFKKEIIGYFFQISLLMTVHFFARNPVNALGALAH